MTLSNEAVSVVGISQQVHSSWHLTHLGQKIGREEQSDEQYITTSASLKGQTA